MIVKNHLLILCAILIGLAVTAQTNFNRLRIGDTVPDITFDYMVNYPGGKAKLSDFKGKLIILDFWSITCTPCIAAMPKLQKLQEQFNDKIQVLLVNVTNNRASVEKAGFPKNTRSPIIPKIKLPFILLDMSEDERRKEKTSIQELFPHEGEPYQVWIDQKGVLRAKSSGNAATALSINNLLNYNKINISENRLGSDLGISPGTESSTRSFLVSNNEIVLNNICYSSVIVKKLNVTGRSGINSRLIDSATGKLTGLRKKGGILELYIRTALKLLPLALPYSRIVLDVKKPENFIRPMNNLDELSKWEQDNIYYYELKLPLSRMDTTSYQKSDSILRDVMQKDMERFFGIRSFWDYRKIKCVVLIRTTEKDYLRSSGRDYIGAKTFTGGREYQNCPLHIFLTDLSLANSLGFPNKPILNETGFSEGKQIDMKINVSLDNLKDLKKELNKYGLDIIEVERFLNVLVITDKN